MQRTNNKKSAGTFRGMIFLGGWRESSRFLIHYINNIDNNHRTERSFRLIPSGFRRFRRPQAKQKPLPASLSTALKKSALRCFNVICDT